MRREVGLVPIVHVEGWGLVDLNARPLLKGA